MEIIQTRFQIEKNKISDINEHLQVIHDYGSKCEHITEMGVRWGSSTWALLASSPKKMISYDIVTSPEVTEILGICNQLSFPFQFIQGDVLSLQIEETDLLFIDTLHTYNQLISELDLHSENVRKYIILHDTNTFGQEDEKIYESASDKIKNQDISKQGLMNAVMDFLNTEKGKSWAIDKIFENNNGLTILERKR